MFTRKQWEVQKRRLSALEGKGVIQEKITCEEGGQAQQHVVGYHTEGCAHNHMKPATGVTAWSGSRTIRLIMQSEESQDRRLEDGHWLGGERAVSRRLAYSPWGGRAVLKRSKHISK